jgi:PadR family transcriptional regulator, regulatory protein PadR
MSTYDKGNDMASAKVRLSNQALKALKLLSDASRGDGLSGAEISRQTGIGSGTLYPMLARLEEAGWLDGNWEKIDPREAARPRRRLYKLTPLGVRSVESEFRQLAIPVGGTLAWTS